MKELLHQILLKTPHNLFDEFLSECQKWYEQPAHTLTEMRTRDNKKIRGDIFEEFCVLYLKFVKKYDSVWRLEDVPDEVLDRLTLKRQDFGIDIICQHQGKFIAVQCKYKKHVSLKKNVLTWKQLSTFYALCMRSGPYEKYIIMTTCDYTRHMGKKTPKDISLCLKTFQNITKEEWVAMCQLEGNTVKPEQIIARTPEELRAARLKFYDIKSIQNDAQP